MAINTMFQIKLKKRKCSSQIQKDMSVIHESHFDPVMKGNESITKFLKKFGVHSVELQQIGVRGDPNIAVLKCPVTGVIFLNHDTCYKYSDVNSLKYWDTTTLSDARRKTEDDDLRRFKLISAYMEGNNKCMLDFGCGNGGLLHHLKNQYGMQRVHGLELQSEMVDILRADNLVVYQNLDEVDGKYDIITLFHVLEHLSEPFDVLKKIKEKLKPHGVVVVEVPHAGDVLLGLDEFKQFSFWNQHLILHTKESLQKMLLMAGFQYNTITGIQRYPLINHLYWLKWKKPGGHVKLSKIRDEVVEQQYEKILEQMESTDTLLSFSQVHLL